MFYTSRSCSHWPKPYHRFLHYREVPHLRPWWLGLRSQSSGVAKPLSGRPRGVKATLTFTTAALVAFGAGYVAYSKHQPFRHSILAVVRCSRVAGAILQLMYPAFTQHLQLHHSGCYYGGYRLQANICAHLCFRGGEVIGILAVSHPKCKASTTGTFGQWRWVGPGLP